LNKNRADRNTQDELSLDEIRKIADKFSTLKVLSFTGGEPFLRSDLMEIIKIFLNRTSVEYINLHTNGYNPEKLKKILESVIEFKKHKYFSVCLSIDDLYEKHDKIRGIPGLYEKNLECISIIKHYMKKDNRFDIMSGLVITRENYETFEKTDCYLNNEININSSVGIQRFTDKETETFLLKKFSSYIKNAEYSKKNVALFSFKNIKGAIEKIVPEIVIQNILNNRRKYTCISGRNLIVMYENGELKPCELLEDFFGNIRDYDYDILKVLSNENVKKIRDKIIRKECCCFWENPIPFNIIYSPSIYWKIIKNIISDVFKNNKI